MSTYTVLGRYEFREGLSFCLEGVDNRSQFTDLTTEVTKARSIDGYDVNRCVSILVLYMEITESCGRYDELCARLTVFSSGDDGCLPKFGRRKGPEDVVREGRADRVG